MLNLNNKGQTLVLFVLLIPIFMIVLVLIYDMGNMLYEKVKLSNICEMVISYGLDNIDTIEKDDIENLIIKNDDKIDNINIDISNDRIQINLTKKMKGLFGKYKMDIVVLYNGKIANGKKEIERIK